MATTQDTIDTAYRFKNGCPFCGSLDTDTRTVDAARAGYPLPGGSYRFFVVCLTCGAQGPDVVAGSDSGHGTSGRQLFNKARELWTSRDDLVPVLDETQRFRGYFRAKDLNLRNVERDQAFFVDLNREGDPATEALQDSASSVELVSATHRVMRYNLGGLWRGSYVEISKEGVMALSRSPDSGFVPWVLVHGDKEY